MRINQDSFTEGQQEFQRNLQAAQQGNASAQFNLGLFYSKGEGVAQDMKLAVQWYEKAAKQGNDDALIALKALGL